MLLVLISLTGICNLYSQEIKTLHSGTKTSIRGLSVVDDSIAWVSGSNGWTAITVDAGKTWKWNQLKSYEKFDFRDIEAFSDKDAVIVSAGSPGVILITADGGLTWKEVYRNDSPEIFLDGMDFLDAQNGIVYGDPIKGKMQLLRTMNGGLIWEDISSNLKIDLIEGEASFAASGTGIKVLKSGMTFIVSGGAQSRIFVSKNSGRTWRVYPCPIIQGKNSTGPFSIAFISKGKGIAAGGDYLSDTSSFKNMFLTKNGGRTWLAPDKPPFGYKSSVEYLTEKLVLATGTSGTDISVDGGRNWERIGKDGFNVVKKAKSGSLVLLAGANGNISRFYIKQ